MTLNKLMGGFIYEVVQWSDMTNMKMIRYQVQMYSKELPYSGLVEWYSNTTNGLCIAKPVNKGRLGFSVM